MHQESTLTLEPSTVASQMPRLSNDAMTGDDDGQRVAAQRLRHSAHGLWLSKGRGNAVIAHDCTIGDSRRHLEHVALEGATSVHCNRVRWHKAGCDAWCVSCLSLTARGDAGAVRRSACYAL